MHHLRTETSLMTMTLSEEGSASLFEWTYSGVDCNLPGNCGDACIYFIPTLQKILESSFIVPVCIVEMIWGWKRIQERLPAKPIPEVVTRARDPTVKVLLLIGLCLCFGMEMGYKMASNQMIWVLNPCHLITVVEIYLLAAAPSRTVMIVFRCLCQALNGPTMALLFPVIHTRLLPFEVTTYYVQHTLILVVPLYLLTTGIYTYEPWNDWSYAFFMTGLMFFYHWVPLQGLAMLSGINLNNMVCPASSDPFSGRYYRIAAILHQTLCCLVFGRVVRLVISPFLPKPIHCDKESLNTVSGLSQESSDKEIGHTTMLLNGDAVSSKKSV